MTCNMDKAGKIAETVEDNMVDLIVKLCENEPEEMRVAVWAMVLTHMMFRCGKADCFVLPPLDEC